MSGRSRAMSGRKLPHVCRSPAQLAPQAGTARARRSWGGRVQSLKCGCTSWPPSPNTPACGRDAGPPAMISHPGGFTARRRGQCALARVAGGREGALGSAQGVGSPGHLLGRPVGGGSWGCEEHCPECNCDALGAGPGEGDSAASQSADGSGARLHPSSSRPMPANFGANPLWTSSPFVRPPFSGEPPLQLPPPLQVNPSHARSAAIRWFILIPATGLC